MKAESTEDRILEFISSRRYGKIYNASDFSNVSSGEAIRKALQRLEKQKKLQRITRGLYLNPKQDPLLGFIHPSLDEIAQEIANKEKLRIIPTGQQAMLQLGLSTQVPMKSIYLTDGGPRSIKIGSRTLVFKPTTPKMLSLKGKISSLVIQALKSLGKDAVDEEIYRKLAVQLAKENPIIAESDASLAPNWIREIMLPLIKQTAP